MYKLQTSFFGGDCTLTDDTEIKFVTLEEAVEYLKNNKPPDEYEWRVADGGSAIAFTTYAGEKIYFWKDGKLEKYEFQKEKNQG